MPAFVRALIVAVISLALGRFAEAGAEERVTFRSLDETTTLAAFLSQPVRDGPAPAVVLMHGCSGLVGSSGREFSLYHAWIRTLVAAGYVTLAVDGAGSRGFGQTCTRGPERRTMLRDRPKDAYGALRYLQAQPFVKADRIAIMGWSQGGGAVLLTINDKSTGRPPDLAVDFRAAVAFYPGSCSDAFQSKPFTQVEPHSWATRTPTLVLFGEADTWTPFPPCEAFVSEARARGNPIEIKGYPGAFHAFDAPNADRRELPAYRNGDRPVPIVATDDEARADALLRALAFLRRNLDEAQVP